MQKPLKLLFSLVCLPLLFGCEKVDITTNNGNKFHIMKSADNYTQKRAATLSFSAISIPSNAEDILRRVNYGEDVVFIYTKKDCSSCQNFLKNAGNFLFETYYKISIIEENTKVAAETINKYVIESGIERVFAHPMSGGTPSMYVMNKERIVELAYGSNDNDEKILTTAFNEYLFGINVTYCGLDNWLSLYNGKRGVIKGTTYVLSKEAEDFFYRYAYPRALKSGRALYVLDIEGFEKEDRQMKELYEITGTEDIEGKILDYFYDFSSDPEVGYESFITVIDDAKSYIDEKYPVSSSL